jgi:hypothetical protein
MRKWAAKRVKAKIAARASGHPAAPPAPAKGEGRFRYSAEQLEFLRVGFAVMQVPELTDSFNARFGMSQTMGKIRAALHNHKMTCGRKPGNPKGTSYLFTKVQAAFIADGYKRLSIAELTAAVNRRFGTQFTKEQLKSFTHNHSIHSGRTGRFEQGHNSWNAGTKGQGLTGANPTSFKKGQIPHTKLRLWSERINRDGFIEISIPERNPYTGAPTRFKHKHVWLWEVKNGPVPKGHAVIFIDGDPQNCVEENLMLVTRAELLSLNLHGYKEVPADLKPSVLALAKVEAKARIRIRPARGRNVRRSHANG